MRILSLANITDTTDIALLENTRCLRHASAHLGQRFSEELWQFLSTVLADMGWVLDDIDLFACVRGPGSFTGLRVTLAAMNGLAFALGKPIVGLTVEELQGGTETSLAVRCGERAYHAYQQSEHKQGPVMPEYGALLSIKKTLY